MAEITSQEVLRRLINLESQVRKLSGAIESVSKAGAKGRKSKGISVSSAATVDTVVCAAGAGLINRGDLNDQLVILATQVNDGFSVVHNLIKNLK